MKEIEQEVEARERAQSSPENTGQSTYTPPTCKTVVQIDAQKEILRKSGRCFTCLRRGHLARECRSRSRCSKCGGRHHIAICPDAPTTSPKLHHVPTSSANSAQTSSPASLNPNAASFTTPTTTSLLVGTKKTMMLQTARATIYNPTAPHPPLQVRMILDSGSQRSYITCGVKDALNLEAEGEQVTSIVAFGSKEPSTQKCMIVRIGMNLHDGPNKDLQLFTVHLWASYGPTNIPLC